MFTRLIERYNTQNSLLVIPSYPKKTELYSQNVCAVSGFTKLSLQALQKHYPDKKIILLTMHAGHKEQIYEENGMLVVRCFKRNSPISYLNLLKYARLFTRTKPVLIEFEFSSFGDTLSTLLLLPVVWAMRLLGKDITLVLHQVLIDLRELTGHIGIAKHSTRIKLLNFGMQTFLRLITAASQTVVVLEDALKKRLSKFVSEEKIMVIPHGVPLFTSLPSKQKARRILNIREDDIVILSFGYLTWYKGTDFLLKAAQYCKSLGKKRIVFILAGGPSFTQGKKTHYQNYIKAVNTAAKNLPNVRITGFVPENAIANYYVASDVVVLPYRSFMSSSGPLSLAIGYNKPFLLSNNLQALLESKDVAASLRAHNLTSSDLVFQLDSKHFLSRLEKALLPTTYRKLTHASKAMSQQRLFSTLAFQYGNVLFPTQLHATLDTAMAKLTKPA